MNRIAKLIMTFTVICSIALVYSGTSLSGKNSEQKAITPPEKVTLAFVNTTHAVLAGVALQQGYYLEEGLQVISRNHSFGKSALQDLLQGNADFATVADPPIMMEIMKGEDLFVIATIQISHKDNAVVLLKDKGIRNPQDLKGKRIGVTSGTTSDFFLDSFLVAYGISRKDVERVDLNPEQLLAALKNGDIDAASVFQPFLAEMQKQLDDQVLSSYDENIYTWTFNVVAKQDYVRKNPQTVNKFLRALIKAEEFVNLNPEKSQNIVADYSGIDIDLIRKIWPGIRFAVTLDQFLVLTLEDESMWAINSGMIPEREIPNYLDYLYVDGLESVKPKAVKILGRTVPETNP